MPLFLKQTMPCRGVWKIEESVSELLNCLCDKEGYVRQLASFRTDKRKQEWLAVRVLLQELLGSEVHIAYHSNGKPYLIGSSLHISISHTKGYVAILLQEPPFAGIDIEKCTNRILRVRKRFMSEEEDKAINPTNECKHLLIYWCAKEVLFKMIGQDSVDFQTQLHVSPFPYAEAGQFIVNETRTSAASSFRLCYEVTPDFVWVWSTGDNLDRE